MKIDIFSGFLGAGKTTLIKKLLKEAYAGEKVVLIENEFGDIGIDGGFLEEAGVNITEMNSGCICCSLVGDFAKALQKVAAEYTPDRILIEPSGVGKLSDVLKAVTTADVAGAKVNAACTVVDASKCKLYAKNFGEFFLDQIQNASCILLSHADKAGEDKLRAAVEIIKERNAAATLVTSAWNSLDGKDILAAMEKRNSLQAELEGLEKELHAHREEECDDPHCHCHHHEHEHGERDHVRHEHEHGERDHGCHEHHHERDHVRHEHHHEHECHDPDCHCHEHHHEHERHDPDCHCHEHHRERDHGHHHADEVFTSWGKETTRRYTQEELADMLAQLDGGEYGQILRAKGIVAGEGEWLHFDYIPSESDLRVGKAGVTGRLCVIGCNLNEEKLAVLFGV